MVIHFADEVLTKMACDIILYLIRKFLSKPKRGRRGMAKSTPR